MHLVFICTGNTCRSPLAEALLRRELAARGLDGIRVGSAGTGAWDGVPASEGSYLVALEHGLDLSGHRARLLTADVVAEADLLLAMGRSHLARAHALGGEGKTHLLGERVGRPGGEMEVRDPFGGDIEGYRRTYRDLEAMITTLADSLAQDRQRETDS